MKPSPLQQQRSYRRLQGIFALFIAMVTIQCWSAFHAQAQQADTLTREQKVAAWKAINRDVWAAFSEAFASGNAEQYINLHTADFLRVGRDGIRSKEQYGERQRMSFKRIKERSMTMTIDFRLLERVVTNTHASERGIYRTVTNKGKADERSHFGKFHVLFRKESGVWKILMDYDSDENKTINATSFEQAHAIDDFEKY